MRSNKSYSYRVPISNRVARRIARPLFRLLFHVLGGVVINGKQNIPASEACIIACNHISIVEPPFVLAFWPVAPEAVGAVDIWSRRGQSFLARIYGGIPVHRGQFDRRLINTALNILRSGRSMVIFPEGGRSHTPGMRRALPGIAYLADQANVRIIPVGVFGSTENYLDLALHGKRPTVGMNIGEPFRLPSLQGKGEELRQARQRNADLVMRHIVKLLPVEYHGVYAEGLA